MELRHNIDIDSWTKKGINKTQVGKITKRDINGTSYKDGVIYAP